MMRQYCSQYPPPLSSDQFNSILKYARVLSKASKASNPDIRIVPDTVLDILQQLEKRTRQRFSNQIGDYPHPQALTLSEIIQHCCIRKGLSNPAQRDTLTRLRRLTTGVETAPDVNPAPFLDDYVREHQLNHDEVRSLIKAALHKNDGPETA